MNCPVCRRPMVVLEIREIEVDHCIQCGGTWLDAGELDLLLEGASNREELLRGMERAKGETEAPRPCPICDKRMEKVKAGLEHDLLLDRCGAGDGIWFDRGELGAVVEMGVFPGGDRRVYELLSDVFGGS